MSNRRGFNENEVREESSWRYPIGIFAATFVLSVIFLYYYIGPTVDEIKGDVPSPAISEEPVAVKIANHTFAPPANYTIYPRARRGGERENLSLYLMWPTKNGYTPAFRRDFLENEPDTRRIDIVIEKRTPIFNEVERIERLYLPQTIDETGIATPYLLQKYTFKEKHPDTPSSGYADTELYLGADADANPVALFCFKERSAIATPECWRNYEYSNTVTVNYRFKRPYLPEWRKIDEEVRAFINDLERKP